MNNENVSSPAVQRVLICLILKYFQPFNGYHHGLPGDDLLVHFSISQILLQHDENNINININIYNINATKPKIEIFKIKMLTTSDDPATCLPKGFPTADNNVVKLHVGRKSDASRMPQQFEGALSGATFQSLSGALSGTLYLFLTNEACFSVTTDRPD